MVASAEKGLRNVRNQTEVEFARSKNTQIIFNARVPPPNLSAEERKALKKLRSDSNIKIMKADKGNCTVVINTKDYELLALLSDCEVYRVLSKRDKSITSVEKQVNNIVWSFVKENKITVPVYRQLKCDKSVTPKIYGLPKLRKSGIPLGPIVLFIGAPTYQLSKFLVNVLSPLLTNDFSIKNSKHFVQRINEIQCDDNDFLVSFDAKRYFTCILVPDVLRIIENLLLIDAVLAEHTKLSVADIMSDLKLCLHSTIFTSKNVLYRQICGASMESCISPEVANIFTEYVERQVLTFFREPPKIWIRYVYDIFCIINYSIIDDFLQHLNSLSPNIQFTVEIEKIDHCHSRMSKLPATLTIHFELPYIKNPRTPTDIYSLTLITLATTSLLLPRACLIECILILV